MYLDLDLPSLAEEAETAGEQFLRKHKPPLRSFVLSSTRSTQTGRPTHATY